MIFNAQTLAIGNNFHVKNKYAIYSENSSIERYIGLAYQLIISDTKNGGMVYEFSDYNFKESSRNHILST